MQTTSNLLRKISKFIILISLIFLIFSHIRRSKDGWGYTYPVIAQQRFDLSCPVGNTQPFQPLITNNPQTGNLKANACIDPTGLITWNGSGAGGAGATGVYLSPSCTGNIAPCFNIPPSGGCFGGAQTSNSNGVITFLSGFPSPAPIVGQVAWVTLEQGGTPCQVGGKGNNWVQTNYCGTTASGQRTITNVVAGTSITVSGNCAVTQNGSANAFLFYGPNIFSQMRLACSPGAAVHIAIGLYILDNTGNGNTTACGDAPDTTKSVGSLNGEGLTTPAYIQQGTILVTPPWYDHTGDTGTVIRGGQLNNITIMSDWTNLAQPHGTPYAGNICGSYNFAILGYNLGTGTPVAETIYPAQGSGINNGNCEIRNMRLNTGNRGIQIVAGRLTIVDSQIISQASSILIQPNAPANNGVVDIIGGYYESGGANGGGNFGVIGGQDSGATSGDQFRITNAELCMSGNAAAINDIETAGEIRLVNVKINSTTGGGCVPGTNASGIILTSGLTLKLVQSYIGANGTGNTINNPSGAIVFDNGGNDFTGGAGYTGAGKVFGNSPLFTTSVVVGNFVPSANFGTGSTISATTGTSASFTFTLTNGSAAVGANPTLVFTFPTPSLVNPARCSLWQVGGTQAITALTEFLAPSAQSATGVTFTYNGTPTINLTEFYQGECSN